MSTWILLRGLTRESRHWGAFPEQLQEALPGARLLALDLPGNGLLNHLESPLSVAGMVEQARAQLAEKGAVPPFHLLALSMGGMVAAAWAEAHPFEIAGCVLINTSFRGFSPLRWRLRLGAWPALLRMPLARTAEGCERIVFQLTSRQKFGPVPPRQAPGQAPWEASCEAWARLRQSHPVSLRNALRQLLAAARFRAPLQAPAPTLVLASAGDGLVSARCSMEIARRWNCPLALHPWAGHDLPLDDGPWVAREVARWLAESF